MGDLRVRVLDDEATRTEKGKTAWIVERDGKQVGMIVHHHSQPDREWRQQSAWFAVRVDYHDVPVHSRDFGDAMKRMAELLAPKPRAKRTKAGKP